MKDCSFLILGLLFLTVGVHAAPVTPAGYLNGPVTVGVSATSPFPVTISGGISSGVNLGTSASATNPQRSGDATTGFYSDTVSTLDGACSGVNCVTINATGVGVGTTLPAYHLQSVQPITTTLTTPISQGATGWYLPVSSTAALSVGEIVQGTSIPNPTIIVYKSGGSAAATTTANGGGSGSSVTVTSGTGISVGMLITDTTTPAHVANQCIVNYVSGTTVQSPCSLAAITNTETLVFYPAVTMSQQSTVTVANGASINFTSNGTDASVNSLTSYGDVTVGGALNLFNGPTTPSAGGETGPSYSVMTLNGLQFINTYTPAGSNGGNLYMGINAGPVFTNNAGWNATYLGTNNTVFGQGGPLHGGTSAGSDTCFGYGTCGSMIAGSQNTAMGVLAGNAIVNGNNNTTIGFSAGQQVVGNNNTIIAEYDGGTSGTKLGNGSANIIIGYDVGLNTLQTGSNNILIGTSSATDTAAAATSFQLNVNNSITGTIAGGTNPSVCSVGTLCRLGHLTAGNFNATTDQAITIGPLTSGNINYLSAATKYIITEIDVGNCSAAATTSAGGFYTATSKGGTIIGAVGTTYANCTSSTTRQRLTAVTNMDTTLFTAAIIYLSLTTPKGSAVTGDVDIYGIPYN